MTRTLPIAALAFLLGAAPGVAAPRLEVLPWGENVVPSFLAGESAERALRAFPPDTLEAASRPSLPAHFAAGALRIDGNFDDWPAVRWRDLRGGGAVVRGQWGGPEDAVLSFALLWTPKGLVLGAHLLDDALMAAEPPDAASPGGAARRVESVLLYVGSESPAVQRYWRGAERAVRLFADGGIEAWTRLHNERPVLFDARLLGAAGRALVVAKKGGQGSADFELFVPWDLLFPALPHEQAGLLVNVLLEDIDGGADKLFAWATRSEAGKPRQAWARLACAGGPAAGTWLVSLAARHLEPEHPGEWSLLCWGCAPEAKPPALELRGRGQHSWGPLRAALPKGPCLVRLHGVAGAVLPWPRQGRIEVDVGPAGSDMWRHDELSLVPTRSSLDAGAAEVEAAAAPSPAGVPRFPLAEDVLVQLEQAAAGLRRIGDWKELRFTHRAIVVWRDAAWTALERGLDEAELRRDLLLGGADALAAAPRAAALWPERTAHGHPVAQVVLRGQRSLLDGSIQPYALYVSRAAAAGAAPLLVILHDLREEAMAPFATAGLAAEVESRGWIALCPYGRGDTGFQLAGERDVLEALAQVQAQFQVDAKRLYLAGAGMGGTGAWMLSLRHAQLFAAAAIVSAYGDMDQPGLYQLLAYHPAELFFYETQNPARLVRPGLKTAYRIVHAEKDPILSVVHARVMNEKLREYEVAHEFVLPATPEHGAALFARELHANLDYLGSRRRAAAGEPDPAWFGGSGGPVATVFARGPFAVVYGTRALPAGAAQVGAVARGGLGLTGPPADARTAEQFAAEWESIFAGRPRLLADSAVTAELQRTTNLVLVGDPRTNRVLAAAAAQLPVHYNGDRFEVQSTSYDFEQAGILFAAANPNIPERTWVVLSAMGERLGGSGKSLLKLGADFVVTDDRHAVQAIGDFRGFGDVPPARQGGATSRQPR